MPKGVYKRKGPMKRDKVTAPARSEAVVETKSFTPVLVRDKDVIIDRQAKRIAQLEGEVKRLRLILDLAIEGGIELNG